MRLIQEIERVRKIMGLNPYTRVRDGLIVEQAEGTKETIKKAIEDLGSRVKTDKMIVNMRSNHLGDKSTMTACNFLSLWKNWFDSRTNFDPFNRYSEEIKGLINEFSEKYPTLPKEALSKFIWVESKGNKNAVNRKSGASGLLQYMPKYWSDYGLNSETVFDPRKNLEVGVPKLIRRGKRFNSKFPGTSVFEEDSWYLLYLLWQQGEAGCQIIYRACQIQGGTTPTEDENDDDEVIVINTGEIFDFKTVDDDINEILEGDATLQRGDTGNDVKYVQTQMLKVLEVNIGKEGVDGDFGPSTEKAVKDIQKAIGLDVTGVIDRCVMLLLMGTLSQSLQKGEDEPCYLEMLNNLEMEDEKREEDDDKGEDKDEDIVEVGDECTFKTKDGVKAFVDLVPDSNMGTKKRGVNFDEIPDGKNNYRSGAPSAEQLLYILRNYKVDNIIAMNRKGRSNDPVSMSSKEEEKFIKCYNKAYGKNIKWVRIGAHDGGECGEGYTGSINKILPKITKNTLVHCTWGADRTGYIVARYLKDKGIVTSNEELWDYTTEYNGWGGNNGRICKGQLGYIAYLEGFYPLREWCKVGNRKENCKICRNQKDMTKHNYYNKTQCNQYYE